MVYDLRVSRIVKLSTGEEVRFKEKFTHGAEMVYTQTLNKGLFERETVEDDGKIVRERPAGNVAEALEATILVMIETVKEGENERPATAAWIKGLPEPDYDELAAVMVDIRKETKQAAAKGKKNS